MAVFFFLLAMGLTDGISMKKPRESLLALAFSFIFRVVVLVSRDVLQSMRPCGYSPKEKLGLHCDSFCSVHEPVTWTTCG